MSDWICPNCGGGFPDEALLDRCFCPWCEDMALGDQIWMWKREDAE